MLFLRRTRSWLWSLIPHEAQLWLILIGFAFLVVFLSVILPTLILMAFGFIWWKSLIAVLAAIVILPVVAFVIAFAALAAEGPMYF